jgi:hypothetical protein
MEKIVTTLELTNKLFATESLIKLKLSNKEKVNLLRDAFNLINQEIQETTEGKVKIQGLGNFVIRNVQSTESEATIRRVVFKGKES